MLFNSVEFICYFLPVTLAGFFLLGWRSKVEFAIAWLVLASLVFYGYWNPVYLLLIIASIAGNYFWSQLLDGEYKYRKLVLAAGVAANLGALGYFKYANFVVSTVNSFSANDYQLAPILLPLAISFFTFQQIAYLVDTYQRKTEEHSFLHYCLFVSFFPQLIAGPIVHHGDMLPQFSRRETYRPRLENIINGSSIFILGLFKKAVIADQLALYANPVFAAAGDGVSLSFFEAWGGVLAYTFQLYFDFSGYSDMAIGLARLFGIKLPLNFNSPYRAFNIIEFWRRWHITLSNFLRDYLYIPLGGNKKGEWRRYSNLLITMTLGGLWHGAGWNFLLWGGLHGAFLTINHGWHKSLRSLPFSMTIPAGNYLAWTVTFLAVTLAWVPFRAPDMASAGLLFESMAGMNGVHLPQQILCVLPFLGYLAEPVQYLRYLANGTMMGLIEMLGMLALAGSVAFLSPHMYQLDMRKRILLLIPTIGLTIQAVFFGRAPSEFLYFQF